MGKPYYVVLKVISGSEGFTGTYRPQVAMAHNYESMEAAATFNIGTHPDFDERLKRTPDNAAYRSIVIPFEHWHEFEVFSESRKGQREFVAYPSEHLTIRSREDGE